MPEISLQMMAAFEDELEKQAVNVRGLAQAAKGLVGKGAGMVSRFGKRQAHSVTGWVPKGADKVTALREMGAGAAPALKRVAEAEKALASGGRGAAKELASARKHLAAAKEVEQLGATSVPGYIKALTKKPGKTLSSGAREAWHGTGTGVGGALGKAGLVGLPGAAVASEAMRPAEEGEKGRGERVGRALGGLAFGLTSMPIAGATALGTGLTAGAGLAGRGLGKAVKKGKRRVLGLGSATQDDDEEDRSGPVERIESNAAQGKPPEGLGS